MLIRSIITVLLVVSACAEDVELNPLSEQNWTNQPSTVCELPKHRCDPYDPEANWRCNTMCGWQGHCLNYTSLEVEWCWRHPGSYYYNGGYCSPFGEPTWPTHCVDGPVP